MLKNLKKVLAKLNNHTKKLAMLKNLIKALAMLKRFVLKPNVAIDCEAQHF